MARANSPAQYANGYLLFSRERALFAQRFDPHDLKTRGEPTSLAEKINYAPGNASAAFSTNEKLLVYSTTPALRTQLTWFDRTGHRLGTVGSSPGDFSRPSLSHDGPRIALEIRDEQSGSAAIWVYDIARGSITRLTFDVGEDLGPIWSPDDQWIAYSFENLRSGTREIHMKRASGGEEKILFSKSFFHSLLTTTWSSDGRTVLFFGVDDRPGGSSSIDVYALSVTGGTVTNLVRGAGGASSTSAVFSPDGHWFAYQSNESGNFEVYLQPFPPTGEKWQVSSNGGGGPQWRGDGRELFLGTNGAALSVEIDTMGRFRVGATKPLFPLPTRATSAVVTADGQRFLIGIPADDEPTTSFTIVLNWSEGLKR